MNKTQMLSDTKNLCIARKDTLFNWYKNCYLIQYKSKDKWLQKVKTGSFSPCFILGDTFTINTLLFHKHIKIFKSKLNVLSNDQIHNNLYLTVENSIEIGKVYQVIEKWVFFKLLFANLTDSSGGKNHSPSKNTIYIYFLQGKFKESNQILSK
jgi:hypothetical protein